MNSQERQTTTYETKVGRGKPDANRSADRRARIVAAARRLLAEEGYDRVTMKQVAREAGVAQGLIHYYFSGKDDLLLAVLRETLEGYVREQRAMMRSLIESTPEGDVESVVEGDGLVEAALAATKGLVSRTPEWYKLRYELFAMGLRDPQFLPGVASFLEYGRRGIEESLEGIADTADERPSESEKDALAAVILSCFDGLALQKLADPEGFDLDAAYKVLAKMTGRVIGTGQ